MCFNEAGWELDEVEFEDPHTVTVEDRYGDPDSVWIGPGVKIARSLVPESWHLAEFESPNHLA